MVAVVCHFINEAVFSNKVVEIQGIQQDSDCAQFDTTRAIVC